MRGLLPHGSSRQSPRRTGSPWPWFVWCWLTAGCAQRCRSGRWPGCSGSWRSAEQADGPPALERDTSIRNSRREEQGQNIHAVSVRTGLHAVPQMLADSPFLALHERLSGCDK